MAKGIRVALEHICEGCCADADCNICKPFKAVEALRGAEKDDAGAPEAVRF